MPSSPSPLKRWSTYETQLVVKYKKERKKKKNWEATTMEKGIVRHAPPNHKNYFSGLTYYWRVCGIYPVRKKGKRRRADDGRAHGRVTFHFLHHSN